MNSSYVAPVYRSLAEVIAEYEQDPEKKVRLDKARAEMRAQAEDWSKIQPIDIDITSLFRADTNKSVNRFQLRYDLDAATIGEDND